MGFDDIEAKVLKLAAVVLLNPITALINLSIRTASYPAKWKLGKIIPLYKGNDLDRQLPGSYRPITILPAVSKIVERAIQEQVVNHMEQNGFIHPNQHAYRRGHSTASALLQLADQLFEAAEEKEIGAALTIDQSSAFDSICHETLLLKLEKYGLDKHTLKWMENYLKYRSQYVEIGSKVSTIKPAGRGVPQGSVLGPVLFYIYVNEMPEVVRKDSCRMESHNLIPGKLFGSNCRKCGALTCFADDTTYAVATKTRLENQILIDDNLENLKIFLNANSLCINETKTCLVETMNVQKRCKVGGRPPSILVRNKQGIVEDKQAGRECRLLGANLSNDLTWKAHLTGGEKPLIPAIRKQLGRLKFICKNIPIKCRKILAEGMLMSRIKYLIAMWGGDNSKLP